MLHSNSLWAKMLYDFGQLDEADKLIRQTFQIELYTLGPRSEEALDDMRVLAEALRLGKRFAECDNCYGSVYHSIVHLTARYPQTSSKPYKDLQMYY